MEWWEIDPFKGSGKLLYRGSDKAVWFVELDDDQMVTCVVRRIDPILEHNKTALNESAGKRWGDGRVVASIPLDIYFKEIMPAKQNGDDAYIKRWLNDGDHRAFRAFGGRL